MSVSIYRIKGEQEFKVYKHNYQIGDCIPYDDIDITLLHRYRCETIVYNKLYTCTLTNCHSFINDNNNNCKTYKFSYPMISDDLIEEIEGLETDDEISVKLSNLITRIYNMFNDIMEIAVNTRGLDIKNNLHLMSCDNGNKLRLKLSKLLGGKLVTSVLIVDGRLIIYSMIDVLYNEPIDNISDDDILRIATNVDNFAANCMDELYKKYTKSISVKSSRK